MRLHLCCDWRIPRRPDARPSKNKRWIIFEGSDLLALGGHEPHRVPAGLGLHLKRSHVHLAVALGLSLLDEVFLSWALWGG